MDVKCRIEGNTMYLSLCGELDEYSAKYVRKVIDEEIENNHYQNVVFDMSKLNFMDSTGIGVLIGRYKKLKNKSKSTYISNPTSTVEKIFKMSGIFEIMPKIS